MQSIQNDRHLRQIILPEIGLDGQSLLSNSRVLVTGSGGLGGPTLYYLTAAGVGTIHVVDDDVVSITNLNRQILFAEADLGHLKATRACERLSALDSSLNIVPHAVRLNEDNILSLFSGMDLIIDCVDNASTRFLVNKACVELNIPLIEAGISRMDGYLFPIYPHQTACFACANQESSAKPKGPIPVLGAAAGMIGSMQAGIAIRMLLKLPVPAGAKHIYSLTDLSKTTVRIDRNPNCPVCGTPIAE